MIRLTYGNIRNQMNPGDVIAFGGNGIFSNIIKLGTQSPVSHVGIIMRTDSGINTLIESTAGGVGTSRLSCTIAEYDGEVWWLPLREKLTNKQQTALVQYLERMIGRPYDMAQAIMSASYLITNDEDDSALFCSELVSASLEQVGVLPPLNSSEVTPADLCVWDIYTEKYFQLKGKPTTIDGFNSISI